ncbi:MAG TPA: phage holin family protein [Thermoanaerobaculia bacterium]|nr:phage holin family protein [Thermoanaerobaculia bacterium]
MGRALLQIVLNGVGVFVASQLVPGIHYTGTWGFLLVVGLVMGIVNLLVKPIVTFFSFPLIILSLGLFFLIINGCMLWLAAALMPHHLRVDGCIPAILGGLVIAILNWLVHAFTAARD